MLRDSDLDTAVSQQIITADQAAQLRVLVQERHRRPHAADERFVVVNNLAELFVSIGQVLFFVALFLTAGLTFGQGAVIAAPVVGVVVGWTMAEFFARYRNMRWPAIVASMAAALSAAWFAAIISGGFEWQRETALLMPSAIAAISLAYAIVRYRLPFLALPFACVIAILAVNALPLPRELIYAVTGAAALLVAIWLDLRDRERITRNSQFAFWLYVAGAPLFLHPVYTSFIGSGQSTGAIGGVLAVALASCLFGLLLDRRSPIVASLLYLGIVISWSARAFAISPSAQAALALFILGVAVMLLGVWWKQARAAVLGLLPAPFVHRLPLTEGH